MHIYLSGTGGRPVRFDALEVTPISPDRASVYGASLPTPGTRAVVAPTVTLTTTADFSFEVPVR